MQELEPFYNWRHLYSANEDEISPFFGREYSEFYYTNQVYNFLIHPQWDDFGSSTLFAKVLYIGYQEKIAIIEFIGEWNDAINNDIMTLKRELIEDLQSNGITKFILIGENVLNFHGSDESYYEEWWQEIEEEDGWIALVNFRSHVLAEMSAENIDHYLNFGGILNDFEWRKLTPHQFFDEVDKTLRSRLLIP
jgi:hypothetical protein